MNNENPVDLATEALAIRKSLLSFAEGQDNTYLNESLMQFDIYLSALLTRASNEITPRRK